MRASPTSKCMFLCNKMMMVTVVKRLKEEMKGRLNGRARGRQKKTPRREEGEGVDGGKSTWLTDAFTEW